MKQQVSCLCTDAQCTCNTTQQLHRPSSEPCLVGNLSSQGSFQKGQWRSHVECVAGDGQQGWMCQSAQHQHCVNTHNNISCDPFELRNSSVAKMCDLEGNSKHTILSDVILRRTILSVSPSCPLAASIMHPDSLSRLWRYINLLMHIAQYTLPTQTQLNCRVELCLRCVLNSQLAHDDCRRKFGNWTCWEFILSSRLSPTTPVLNSIHTTDADPTQLNRWSCIGVGSVYWLLLIYHISLSVTVLHLPAILYLYILYYMTSTPEFRQNKI